MASPSRRQFLGIFLGAGAALASADASALRRRPRPRVAVYRLSTHGRRTCGACKAHAANRYYRTREAADAGRAHTGCNCAIVAHPLPAWVIRKFFVDRDVFDRRWRRRKPRVGS